MRKRITRHITLQVALLIISSLPARTQTIPPAIQWQKSLGGSDGEEASCILQTRDGGYIVSGNSSSGDFDVTGHHTSSPITTDCWIVKLSNVGSIQWEKSIGGSNEEGAGSILQTRDGGYIVGCSSSSTDGDVHGNHGQSDYWVVKLDSFGAILWDKCYGGSGDDDGCDIKQTPDGGYVMVGTSNSNDKDVSGHHGVVWPANNNSIDIWVVKIDSGGTLQWEKSMGGIGEESSLNIQVTFDGGYILAGYTTSLNDGDVTGNHGGSDCWIVKLDSLGRISWEKTYGGSSDETANCIVQTSDSGYVFAGFSGSTDGDVHKQAGNGYVDYWIVKLDKKGNLIWEKSLGGSGYELATCIEQTNDGGLIVGGNSFSKDGDVTGNHGEDDYWIVKLDPNGNKQWQKSLGGSNWESCVRIIQTKDLGYVIAGTTHSNDGDITRNHGVLDYWIVKLGLPPMIASPQQITLHLFICSTSLLDTIWVHNNGSKKLVLSSGSFGLASSAFAIVSPSLPDTIQSADSSRFIVSFSPSAAGVYSATLNIVNNDTIPGHNPWQISISGRKDSIGFSVNGVASSLEGTIDTIDFGYITCGTPRDSTFTLTNTSSIPTTFFLNRLPSAGVDTVKLGTGASQVVSVHLPASNTSGQLNSWVTITDICGHVDTVLLTAIVEQPSFSISTVQDTTICPNDTVAWVVNVGNLSHETQTVHVVGSDLRFSISPDSLSLTPGNVEKVNVVFHGSPIEGSYSTTYNVLDDCGGLHSFNVPVKVSRGNIAASDVVIDSAVVGLSRDSVVLVRNKGTRSVTVDSVLLSGCVSCPFSLTSQSSFTLAPGDSERVSIHYAPTKGGEDSIRLEIVTHTPCVDTLFVNVAAYATLNQLRLCPDSVTIQQWGNTFDVKINLAETISNNSALSFVLFYNPSLMMYRGLISSTVPATQNAIAPGEERITFANGIPSTALRICGVSFEAMASSNDTITTPITIDSIVIAPPNASTSSCTTSVTIAPPCGMHGVLFVGASSIAAVSPNPLTGEGAITVHISPIDRGQVTLRLYSILGTLVRDWTGAIRSNPSDDKVVAIDARGLGESVYSVVLQTPTTHSVRPLIVVH